MSLKIEKYDPEIHDEKVLAELVYLADEMVNSPTYDGKVKGIKVLRELIEREAGFLGPPYLNAMVYREKPVGIFAISKVKEKSDLESDFGLTLAKVMDIQKFIEKIPVLLKLSHLISGEMDKDGHYIFYLSVAPPFRGKGIGTKTLRYLDDKYGDLYLHVRKSNKKARSFYRSLGFRPISNNTVFLDGKKITNFLMEKKF